jgi:hypothetical protein
MRRHSLTEYSTSSNITRLHGLLVGSSLREFLGDTVLERQYAGLVIGSGVGTSLENDARITGMC